LKILAAALLVVAALAGAGRASADPLRYGAADDWPKFHPCGDVWWTAAAGIGYQDVRMTVQWDATAPAVIPYQDNLRDAIDCAKLNGVRPILAVYAAKPTAIGSDADAQSQFASFVALVGQTFPDVRDFIVGNEPNVNRFWQPQFVNGADAAGADYEHTLARTYDALKGVRPDAVVWGPAISSRGNDSPSAASNPGHSPLRFIEDMGIAYKASGRTSPIFDEFDMHPYPLTQDTDRFSKKFPWPQAGAADLDRIKQALWDAFARTGQPTVTEQPAGTTQQFAAPQQLPIDLDEAGEQTVDAGHEPAYDGTPENVTPIDEAQQAASHVELAEIAACDPAVETLLYFPLIDDPQVSTGFQSGELFADFAQKQSYGALKAKIASAHGECQGGVPGVLRNWSHTTQVVGAKAIFGGPGARVGSQPVKRKFGTRGVWTSFVVGEDAVYRAVLLRARSATARTGSTVATLRGTVKASFRPGLDFKQRRPLRAGYYRFSVELRAALNTARVTRLTSRTFAIGKPQQAKQRHRAAKKPTKKRTK
jgi:hypothetical protein